MESTPTKDNRSRGRGGTARTGGRGGGHSFRGRGRGQAGRRGSHRGNFRSKYDEGLTAKEMERKRKWNEAEYYEHPPKITETDEREEAQLEEMLFGSANVEAFGNELAGTEANDGDEGKVEDEGLIPKWEEDEDENEANNEVFNTIWIDKGGVMTAVGSQAVLQDRTSDVEGDEDDENNGDDESEDDEGQEEETNVTEKQPQPAWVDDDDVGETVALNTRDPKKRRLRKGAAESVVTGDEYTRRLRERFEATHHQDAGGPSWAKLPDNFDTLQSDEDEDDILATAEALVGSSSQRLPPSIINVTRFKDANQRERARGLHAIHFHPNGQLMLTGGYDKTLRLFQIDGKKNPKVQGVVFQDTAIFKAWFSPDGKEVIAVGRKPWLYIYDLISGKVNKVWYPAGRSESSVERAFFSKDNKYLAFCGKAGLVHLTSNNTKHKIAAFKMNNTAETVAFSPDGLTLYAGCGDASVYQWDLRTRRCLYKFVDEGMSTTASIGISADSQYYAVGSQGGVVNVYDEQTLATRSTTPRPQKSLMNLQTSISCIKFNHDSQLMGMASWVNKRAFRLVHLPSLTVFGNWPSDKTPLGKIIDFDFSPHSGYLALGSHSGRVLLYRLNHYTSV